LRKDNRISFIISDETGYYLFIESRSLIPADKQTINAVSIDPVSMVRLKHFFFSNSEHGDFEDELTNAIIEESKQLEHSEKLLSDHKADIHEIFDEEIAEVDQNLKANPPLHPDYKRTVDFYSNKFQYAELHFEGQNFKSYSVKVPPKILPYRNKEIRDKLTTKLKLFENIAEKESFEKFEKFVAKKKAISEKYLTPLSSRKKHSILRLDQKGDFQKEVDDLKTEINRIRQKLLASMIEEMKSAKENLRKTLYDFLISNPTVEMINMGKDNYEVMADSTSEILINKLPVPNPSKILLGWKIVTAFSDITYEDLSDKELLEELKEKELIDEADMNRITRLGKGIEIK